MGKADEPARKRTWDDVCDMVVIGSLAALVVLAFVAMTGMLLSAVTCTAQKNNVPVVDVMEYVDPDSGVRYLICGDDKHYSITPRLNADGSVMTDGR